MEKACETFISSTYWTDRSGPSAALATINKMIRIDSPMKLIEKGKKIRNLLTKAAKNNNIEIQFSGSLCLTSFQLNVREWQTSLTFYTQEMLARGFLASDRVYANLAHDERSLKLFGEAVNIVFKKIKKAEEKGNTKDFLKGPIRINSFGRVPIKIKN